VSPGQASVPVPSVDPLSFRRAMGSFATGVTIVTVRSIDGGLHGMTVNSFSSVSLDPMLVLVCLSESSRGLALIEKAGVFGVNVLSSRQTDVSRRFGNRHRTADSTMFDGIPIAVGATGCPALLEAAAVFDCRVDRLVPAGDHLIVIGEVVSLVHRSELEPLVFHAGAYRSLRRERLAPGRPRVRVACGP
jgi:3-hydroxy-9,10-secoandrosta-1,3,5(10)-triene-9,17-dione monooxygenase reductase component